MMTSPQSTKNITFNSYLFFYTGLFLPSVFVWSQVHYSPPLGAENIQENWAGSLTLELPITRRHALDP